MSKQFPHPFSDIAKRFREMRRKLPAKVSNIAVEEFKSNFRLQGYRDKSGSVIFWKERKRSNKGRSLTKSGQNQAIWDIGRDKDKGRALLIKSGRLRRGLRAVPTFELARVINDVPYAAAHNQGFKGTVTVRSFTRKGKKTRIKVRSFRRKMDITARPFMVTGKPLMDNIEKAVLKEIEVIFKNAKDA